MSRVLHTAQALVDVILEVDALPARGGNENARTDDHENGAGENVVGLFLFLFTKADGNRHGGTDTDQIGQCKIDDNKRHGQIQRRKGGVAQKLSYEDAVQELVQGGCQHADCAGYGGDKKQFCRCYFGE